MSGPIPRARAPTSSPRRRRRWPRPGRRGLGELDAVLGLAGANVPAAAERLAARLPFARARIESDAVIAVKGALGEDDGVTAALGTGSVFGVQRGGAVRMIGGWGFLLGDQGSGARMGRALLEAALLAHDGLATRAPLLARCSPNTAGPRGRRLRPDARPRRISPARCRASLAAAAAGDPAAAAILAAAEADVARRDRPADGRRAGAGLLPRRPRAGLRRRGSRAATAA